MRSQRLLFFLLSWCAAFILFSADEAAGKSEKKLVFPDRLEEGFHLHVSPVMLDFSFAASDAHTLSGEGIRAVPEANEWDPLKIPPGGERKKKAGRAMLILSGFILAETVRYWVESKKWREDWNYRFIWKDQKIRFFTLEANRFDSNPFVTNWTHLVSGHLYYSMGRYHNLDHLESLLVSLGSSLWWEYVTEWREVISINDNLFSGLGGISLGEPLFQIGDYFSRRPGILNKAIGFIFNPAIAFNDAIGGRKGSGRTDVTNQANPRFALTFGPQLRGREGEAQAPPPQFHVRMDAVYRTIPGFADPQMGDVKRWIKKTLLSEFSLDLAAGNGRVQEFNLFSRAVLCGHFWQELSPAPGPFLRGYNYFFGLATSFDLFKKKATVYYDKGEYHYDFAAGERIPLPTSFADKYATVNLLGPVFAASLFAGPAQFRFTLAGSVDFALVNALALNRYSLDHDIFEPRLKTTLVHYGYYYAYGGTFSAAASIQFRNFRCSGQCKYQAYGSIEGLDRFQDKVADDCHLRDSRLSWRFSLEYALARLPLALGFASEGIDRRGSMPGVNHRESEQRTYTHLVFSF